MKLLMNLIMISLFLVGCAKKKENKLTTENTKVENHLLETPYQVSYSFKAKSENELYIPIDIPLKLNGVVQTVNLLSLQIDSENARAFSQGEVHSLNYEPSTSTDVFNLDWKNTNDLISFEHKQGINLLVFGGYDGYPQMFDNTFYIEATDSYKGFHFKYILQVYCTHGHEENQNQNYFCKEQNYTVSLKIFSAKLN